MPPPKYPDIPNSNQVPETKQLLQNPTTYQLITSTSTLQASFSQPIQGIADSRHFQNIRPSNFETNRKINSEIQVQTKPKLPISNLFLNSSSNFFKFFKSVFNWVNLLEFYLFNIFFNVLTKILNLFSYLNSFNLFCVNSTRSISSVNTRLTS